MAGGELRDRDGVGDVTGDHGHAGAAQVLVPGRIADHGGDLVTSGDRLGDGTPTGPPTGAKDDDSVHCARSVPPGPAVVAGGCGGR
ncbi:hypothetical protein GCM10023263_55230 [Phytohabitans rumicis]